MDSPPATADVDRLISELTSLFTSNPAYDDLKIQAHLQLSAFVGRTVLRDDGYAPPDEIAPVLQAAREKVQRLVAPGQMLLVRAELLTELDRTIAVVRPAVRK